MLPFLKANQEGSASTTPNAPITRKTDDEGEYDGMHAAAEDMLSAFHNKDVKALASAFKAAFEICDSAPHEEGEHI